jgi:prophage regulatory protein
MAERLLRLPEVRARTGLGRTTLWRRELAGDFPRRRRLGPSAVAWLESEVEAWIASRPPAAFNPVAQKPGSEP